jgi:uncharacterized protein (DUF58 family)
VTRRGGATRLARGRRAVTPVHAALTTRGRALLGGGVIVAGAGTVLRYPELIGLGAAGVAAVLVAVLLVLRAPALQVERLVTPVRVPRGVGARAEVRVRNGARGTSAAVRARDVAGSGTVPFAVPRLRPGAVHEGVTDLPTSRRGVVVSGPLLVDRGDPLGLALRTLNTGQSAELYVRPRAVDLPEIGASLARSVDGPQADTMMEGTLAFHALRDYVPGDELRHVHWRASAHAGKLVVKQHVDTAHAALAVVLDTILPGENGAVLPEALGEAFETAVDCAASVAVVAAVQRQPLLLIDATGVSLLPGAARRHRIYTVDDVLDSLTTVNPVTGAPAPAGAARPGPAPPRTAGPADPLPGALRRLAASGRGSLAVVISTRPMGWLAAPLQSVTGSYARVLAVQAVAGDDVPRGAARTGRIFWVGVRRADELAPAMVRARAAA